MTLQTRLLRAAVYMDGLSAGVVEAKEIREVAEELAKIADTIRIHVTMHACSVCGQGHATREENFMQNIADKLAAKRRVGK